MSPDSRLRRPFIEDILRRIAPKIGAKVTIEPLTRRAGYIVFANGTRSFFRDNKFDLNGLGAINIAKDKALASFFLKHFGYNVPPWLAFWERGAYPKMKQERSVQDAVRFAKDVGFPVFVKPNDLSQGEGVRKVFSAKELLCAAREAFKLSDRHVATVQATCVGRDYRIVVLDGEVLSAYERVPLRVVGDGESSIRTLLRAKQKTFAVSGRDTTININDPRLVRTLKRQRMTLSTVVPDGERVQLLEISNLSAGGDSIDCTAIMHASFRKVAAAIARDMGLRLCGVDLIADDIEKQLAGYAVIEINSAPGLDNYAFGSKRQQQHLVDELYLRVLRAVANTHG